MFGYSLGDFVIDMCVCGGMFYAGHNTGKNKVIRQMQDQQRDDEINKLREEINRLKQGKS
jgi:hypothetical protein